MGTTASFLDSVNQVISAGVQKGILHRYTDDEPFSGIALPMDGRMILNFGSCSYLGLEFDESLKQGAIDAVSKYGTQFSSSRAYVSIALYEKLEKLFREIFSAEVVIAPTTSLAHIAAIPVLVDDSDAVIIDHQVHSSVQTAVALLKPKGVHVEMIRHNRMDLLEEKLRDLRQRHRKVWYMADGIYSMYGDSTPVEDLKRLLDTYPELHLYVDDAHGMSCFGKNGSGFFLQHIPVSDRVTVSVSLAKGFATGGSVLLFSDAALAKKVRTCGGPLITSGPLQPATLGAAVASAELHLSPKITQLQEDLHENILYTNLLLKKYGLPLVAETQSPVFFIAAGLPRLAYNLLSRMMKEGFYLNLATFPAVPMKNSGVRFTITALHTFSQIDAMLEALAYHYLHAMEEENLTLDSVCKAFKMEVPELRSTRREPTRRYGAAQALNVQHFGSICDIPAEEWDSVLGHRGSFNHEGMAFLEKAFGNRPEPEHNWDFDYLLIRDPRGKIILATFLTTALMKDDMLSSSEVSGWVEEIREKQDPYFKTSRVVMVGSLLTEGNHLFVDRSSIYWKQAMELFYDKMSRLQEDRNASALLIRDLPDGDGEMDLFMSDNGFFRLPMPQSYGMELKEGDFMAQLSANARKNLKKEVLRFENEYETVILDRFTEVELLHFYHLYLQVKTGSFEINTFTLPFTVFRDMANDDSWEAVVILPKNKTLSPSPTTQAVAVVWAQKGKNTYTPMLVGIDKNYSREKSPYRQVLYKTVLRARELGMKHIHLGFSAGTEKRKVGAGPQQSVAYMQAKDNYMFESLDAFSSQQARSSHAAPKGHQVTPVNGTFSQRISKIQSSLENTANL